LTNPTHWNMMMNLKLLPLFEIADHGSFPSSPSFIIDKLEHGGVSFLVLICMCASCSLYQVFLLGSMNSWKIESSSSFILWTISWTNARNNTMLLFLIFLRVILSLYFVGACSWDGSSHSSELYSSWVCTNALHWFHCRQSGSCKFTFSFGFDVFQWFLKKNSCWPVLDSIGFLITVEKVHWG
jgi:hypothetical protein